MTGRGCRRLDELRSAFVDGALSDPDRDRVLAHLAGCRACRADVEELRAVQDLLHRSGPATDGPDSAALSSRLVSIAGTAADAPVWERPFRRTRPGSLPSPRRTTRVRAGVAVLAAGGLLSTLGLVGYAAAPAEALPPLGDPSEHVRSEFTAALARLPLSSRALEAVMLAPAGVLASDPSAWTTPGSAGTGAVPVSRAVAVAALRRAAREPSVDYRGTQQVYAARGRQTLTARVRVTSDAGRGSALAVDDAAGRDAFDRFVPAASPVGRYDQRVLALLLENHTITGWAGGRVAGREVTVVQAASRSGAGSGPVARWWVDDRTGLLLWQETYDDAGAVAVSVGFTSLRLSAAPVFLDHIAPRLTASTATTGLTVSDAAQLGGGGWYGQDRLAGLSLVRMVGDGSADPAAVHLVYSDGVSTVSVYEQRGWLAAAPAGARRDASLRAFVRDGTPALASWQSGDTVFTVASDAPGDLLADAVASLPHRRPAARTTMSRVRAGWSRILR